MILILSACGALGRYPGVGQDAHGWRCIIVRVVDVGIRGEEHVMKTIREIVIENRQFPELSLVPALEAREKERDEAERERVVSVICKELHSEGERERFMDAIYPPPKPEKLPAGYWWVKRDGFGHEWVCRSYSFEFVPSCGFEYRRWDDPPPEVIGK